MSQIVHFQPTKLSLWLLVATLLTIGLQLLASSSTFSLVNGQKVRVLKPSNKTTGREKNLITEQATRVYFGEFTARINSSSLKVADKLVNYAKELANEWPANNESHRKALKLYKHFGFEPYVTKGRTGIKEIIGLMANRSLSLKASDCKSVCACERFAGSETCKPPRCPKVPDDQVTCAGKPICPYGCRAYETSQVRCQEPQLIDWYTTKAPVSTRKPSVVKKLPSTTRKAKPKKHKSTTSTTKRPTGEPQTGSPRERREIQTKRPATSAKPTTSRRPTPKGDDRKKKASSTSTTSSKPKVSVSSRGPKSVKATKGRKSNKTHLLLDPEENQIIWYEGGILFEKQLALLEPNATIREDIKQIFYSMDASHELAKVMYDNIKNCLSEFDEEWPSKRHVDFIWGKDAKEGAKGKEFSHKVPKRTKLSNEHDTWLGDGFMACLGHLLKSELKERCGCDGWCPNNGAQCELHCPNNQKCPMYTCGC